jgi:hypothetical protein
MAHALSDFYVRGKMNHAGDVRVLMKNSFDFGWMEQITHDERGIFDSLGVAFAEIIKNHDLVALALKFANGVAANVASATGHKNFLGH